MCAPYQYFIPLLSLFLVRVDLTDIYPLGIPVTLEKVMDGDTLKVRQGRRVFSVRLSRIDAPEKGQPLSRDPQSDAGRLSTDCLLRTLKGRTKLRLFYEKMDIYGRVLGDVDGLSFELVRNGCAGLYPHAVFKSPAEKMDFLRAYAMARLQKNGVWQWGGYELPKNWRKKNKSRFKRRSAGRRWHR